MPEHVAEVKFIKVRSASTSLMLNYASLQLSSFHLMSCVKIAQSLEDYGVHFYKVFRTKKELSVRACKPIWTGISVHGVSTCEQQGSARAVTRTHSWQNTQKISFKRRRFSIKPKPEASIGKVAKLDYYTDSHRKCAKPIMCRRNTHTVTMFLFVTEVGIC